jgi:hypothetical protein
MVSSIIRKDSFLRPPPPPSDAEVKPVLPDAPHSARQLRPSMIVLDKREVFMAEVMVQRKREEIARLSAEIEAAEAKLSESERQMADMSNELKMTSIQMEAAVARAQKATQSAEKKRLELQRECQLLKQRLAIIRSGISKSRDQLDAYRQYRKFLLMLTPEGDSLEDFYRNPSKLIQELDRLEETNLFLIRESHGLQGQIDRNIRKVNTQMSMTDANLAEMQDIHDQIPVLAEFTDTLREGSVKYSEQIESELVFLTERIAHTHSRCLGNARGMPALLMLERIEAALEDLYNRLQRVKPQFAEAKQKKKDEARLEQQMVAAAEKKVAEQKLKYDQAVERAQMPIKKRTGRPPVKRMLPIALQRADPETLYAEQFERGRIEKLLYGGED